MLALVVMINKNSKNGLNHCGVALSKQTLEAKNFSREKNQSN
jgi:hypothetical protein